MSTPNVFVQNKTLLYTVLSTIIYIIGIILHNIFRGQSVVCAIKDVTFTDIVVAIIVSYLFALIGRLFYPLCY